MAHGDSGGLNALTRELGSLLQPLEALATDAVATVRDLGFDWPLSTAFPADFTEVVADAEAVAADLRALEAAADDSALESAAATLASDVARLVGRVIDLEQKIESGLASVVAFATQSGIAADLPWRLLDLVVARYLVEQHGVLAEVLTVLGLLEWTHQEAEPARFRLGCILPVVHWDRIPKLITNPREVADAAYGWSTAFDADLLVDRLGGLLRRLGLPLGMALQDDAVADALGLPTEGRHELRVNLLQAGTPFDPAYGELGLRLFSIPAGARPAALALMPYASGTVGVQGDLGRWRFGLAAEVDVSQGVAVLVRPPGEVELQVGLLSTPGASAGGGLKATLANADPTGAKTVVLGAPGATRFEFEQVSAALEVAFRDAAFALAVEAGIEGAALVVQGGDGDGFLQRLLPSEPLEIGFDLTLGWSTRHGFYLKGAAGLEYTWRIDQALGPITITTVTAGVKAGTDGVAVTLAASADGQLGPVSASVEEIGIIARIVPGKRGLLGDADLTIDFKPPTGVGLAIDASAVTGGGYLEIDDGNYAGVLQLSIEDTVDITVIGILTTRLPDGSKIFSLKILGAAEFSPIQLGMGFVLTGIGVAAAIECAMNADALRAAVYAGSLTSLLFPQDAVENAPKIIADLKAFFPPERNHNVFGAMVKIGWGGATALVKAAVGVFLELEGATPVRIALAGVGGLALPTDEDAILVISFQVIGILDLANQSISIDASLHGSRLLAFTLDGDIALRASWGEDARFALSAGGFYPGFQVPAGFPALRRMSISLGEDNPRVALMLYFAAAESSIQLGAQLLLYLSKDLSVLGFFEIDGAMGFDAILHFHPLSFQADLYARLTVKRNHEELCGVDLDLFLEGPNNYHARGHAELQVCGFKKRLEFDQRFGEVTPELPAPPLSPLQLLLGELAKEGAWRPTPPPWTGGSVVPAARPDAEAAVDPGGGLEFRQQALPLRFTIGQLGQALVVPAEEYLDVRPRDGEGTAPVEDRFALGQFEKLTDEQRIAAPPFEKATSGLAFSSRRLAVPLSAPAGGHVFCYGRAVGYENVALRAAPTKKPGKAPRPPARKPRPPRGRNPGLTPEQVAPWQRLSGRRYHDAFGKPTAADLAARIRTVDQRFAVVSSEGDGGKLVPAPGAPVGVSYAEARRWRAAQPEAGAEIVGTARAAPRP